jgi:hypothetical protein
VLIEITRAVLNSTLTLDNLPLSVCCRHSGDIDKDSVEITILSSAESENIIQLKTGVFFKRG